MKNLKSCVMGIALLGLLSASVAAAEPARVAPVAKPEVVTRQMNFKTKSGQAYSLPVEVTLLPKGASVTAFLTKVNCGSKSCSYPEHTCADLGSDVQSCCGEGVNGVAKAQSVSCSDHK